MQKIRKKTDELFLGSCVKNGWTKDKQINKQNQIHDTSASAAVQKGS